MISYNTTLNEEVSIKRSFARAGSPWEFNLRDVLRWAALLQASQSRAHPSELLRSVYLDRFRDAADRRRARLLFDKIQTSSDALEQAPFWGISATHLQVGAFHSPRQNLAVSGRPGRVLKMQLRALETAGHCVSQSWLAIVTGPRKSGKTELVRTLANLSGRLLCGICLNSATDTMEILGSFEQVDDRGRVFTVVEDMLSIVDSHLYYDQVLAPVCLIPRLVTSFTCLLHSRILLQSLQSRVEHLLTRREGPGHFEWVNGPLIRAMKQGDWLLLDGANLCNLSVLDRPNSLCEVNGFLTLSERGYVDGLVQVLRPHPNFRIFMSVDPQYGELSRAMRNRGIEIALSVAPAADDSVVLQDHFRLPAAVDMKAFNRLLRRGLLFDGPFTSLYLLRMVVG
ncbi:hypothetical protein C8R43DRAFT_1154043 [Mycena crocata]|nr:hypothetical protein C8R43DRAFT_1154043 [Mycena crocata]